MAIPLLLQNLDFKSVDLYNMAQMFYDLYRMNVFEPFTHIPVLDYSILLRELFGPIPNLNEIIALADQNFFEYLRIEVLHLNGFITIEGYYRNKDEVQDITLLL
jgi:hypothetical protein